MPVDSRKFSRAQRVVHWATLLALLAAFVSHDAMKASWRVVERGGEAVMDAGTGLHVWMGVAVLALTVLRIGLRLVQGAPAPVEGQHPLVTLAAAGLHGLLYLLLLALPMAGLAAWFGGVGDLAEVHEVLFNLGLLLVAGHVAMALVHQFVLKDRLIARML